MATKKQRSRRAKTFRHDYALVQYDEEGNEIEVSSAELRGKSVDGEKDAPKAAAKGAPAASRRGTPQPPSWERAAKRGGLTGVALAVLLAFVLHGPIYLALIYGVMFIPLTYWMDGLSYRWYTKRQAAASSASPRGSRRPGARKR